MKKNLPLAVLFFTAFFVTNNVYSQSTVTTTFPPAASPFTAASNGTIKVEGWGGGGAGGGCNKSILATLGSGGGGGAYKTTTFSVTNGQQFTVVIGTGGTGVSNADGNQGNPTQLKGPLPATTILLTANQGTGGKKNASAGSNGGIGDKNGGNGSDGLNAGISSAGGGGGGGGGNNGNGSNGSNTGGGNGGNGNPNNAPYKGGKGGDPVVNNAGGNGVAPGGGGAGSAQFGNGGNRAGGNGGDGQMVITFYYKPVISSLTVNGVTAISACAGSNAAIVINGQYLDIVTSVTFATGQTATINSQSATAINVTLPNAAVTGNITVTSPGGSTTTAFTVNAAPANPGNPTITNSPQCATTGVTLARTGSPGADTWYWETTSLATLTTNGSGANYGPVTLTGTYYIRAYNSGCWSTGQGSVTVASTDLLSSSGAGTVAATYACSGSSVAVSGNVTPIYWQGSSDGSSFTDVSPLNSGTSYSIPSSSPYSYWRVRAQGCATAVSNAVQVLPLNPSSSVTITQNITLGGTINVTGDFTVSSGATVTLPSLCALIVNANNITINGIIDGTGKGRAGGAAGTNGITYNGGSCGNADAFTTGGTGGSSASGSGGGVGGATGVNGNDNCGDPTCIATPNNVTGAGGGGAGQGGGYGGKGGTSGTETWSSSTGGAGGGTTATVGVSCSARTSCTGVNGAGCPGIGGTFTANTFDLTNDVDFGGGGAGAGGGGSGFNPASGTLGSGGNGGGAVKLYFTGVYSMSATGRINMNGSAGGTGGNGGSAKDYGVIVVQLNEIGGGGGGGGAGGGSGGGILLYANACSATINIASGAQLNAAGGNGGAGGSGGAADNNALAGKAGKGGGGGGGGRVKIFKSSCGAYTNNATISATGGLRGDGTTGDAVAGPSAVVTDLYPLVAGTITSSNQSICSSPLSPTTINADASTGGTCTYTYQWYYTTSGSAVTNSATGANSGWSTVGGNVQNLAAATITGVMSGAATYRFQRRTGSGASCFAWTTESVITVNANPTVNPTNANVCEGLSITLTGSGSPAASNTWTAANTNATASGTNSTTGTVGGVLGTNTVTITYQDNHGCTATSDVTVTAPPTITNFLGLSPVCNGQVVNTVTQPQVSPSGVLASYNISGGASIGLANQTGLTGAFPTFTAANSGSSDVTVTIHVTPVYNTCTGADRTFDITVSPTLVPTVSLADNTSNHNGAAVCDAATIIYTATATNQGTSDYIFKNGNTIVQNSSSNQWTTSAVNNLDVITCVITSTEACASPGTVTSNAITAHINACGYVWSSTATTHNWNTTGNWVGGAVPPSTTGSDVTIQTTNATNYPTLPSNYTLGNVTLQPGATLDLSTYTLSVKGSWAGSTNATTAIVTGTGAVILSGSAAQTITGKTQFATLRLNNTNNASMNGSVVDITNGLELQAGQLQAGTGTLTFKSSSSSVAAVIDNFTTGYTGTLSGQVYYERSYDAAPGSYGNHLMGSPIHNAPVAQFGVSGGTPGFAVPNNCNETALDYTSPWTTMSRIIESNGAGCGMKQTFFINSGNTVDVEGYWVQKNGAGKITLNGDPNLDASYSRTLLNSGWTVNSTSQGHSMGPGWGVIANPYPAYLDITTIGTQTGFDGQKKIWFTTGSFANSYQDPGPLTSNVLAPGQAMMVHRSTGGSTSAPYTLSKTNLTRTPSSTTFYQLANDHTLSVLAQNNATQLMDISVVAFNSDATAGFDPEYDGEKMAGALNRHTLYTYNTNPHQWMSNNVLKSIDETSTVPMGFEPGATGSYTLSFDGLNSFDPTSYITLEDTKLNTYHDVRSGNYTLTADSADDWNRFVLHFTPAATIAIADQQCSTLGSINVTQPGTAQWQYSITDANGGAAVGSGSLNATNPITVNAAAGTYTLTLTDNNNYTVVKNIIVNGTAPVTAAFTPVANVTTNTDVAFNSTTANATNYYWDFGDGSTASGQNTMHSYADTGTYTVTLIVVSANGCSATAAQTITVTENTATGVSSLVPRPSSLINIWSNENRVFIDFSKQTKVESTIEIYNVLGQLLVNETFGRSTIYTKPISNLEAAYVIVKVKNDDAIFTKRVLILNK